MNILRNILKTLQLLWSKTNRWHRVIFIFIIVQFQVLPGGQVGFLCNDPALSYPYTGDTVNWKWLMVTTIFLPLLVLLLVEKKQCSSEYTKHQALRWYKEYIFGFLLNLTFVQLLKLVVGSPRPHFFDTCEPKEALSCQESEYVSSYTCTKAHWINQSDKSFPSGHTSLAMHAGIFIIYYLCQRATEIPARGVRIVQILCVVSAVLCSVSRMWDHRHHWWDVVAGAVIAVPILLYTILILCKNFECTVPKTTEPTKNDDQSNCVSS